MPVAVRSPHQRGELWLAGLNAGGQADPAADRRVAAPEAEFQRLRWLRGGELDSLRLRADPLTSLLALGRPEDGDLIRAIVETDVETAVLTREDLRAAPAWVFQIDGRHCDPRQRVAIRVEHHTADSGGAGDDRQRQRDGDRARRHVRARHAGLHLIAGLLTVDRRIRDAQRHGDRDRLPVCHGHLAQGLGQVLAGCAAGRRVACHLLDGRDRQEGQPERA